MTRCEDREPREVRHMVPGGVELCREIRRSDPSTPVVFYSGAGLDSEREAALAAGAQAYLLKPGDAASLVGTVRRLLH